MIKSYYNHKKDLKVITTMYISKKINKTSLSSNDGKRLKTFDKITTYPYGANAFKACERMEI